MVAGQQMFDQRRYAPLFFAIEFRVFKKRKVPRTADPPHVVQHEPGVVTQFIELFAGGLRDHGANYINLRNTNNSTLVLVALTTLFSRFLEP
jgi:hypothetical protein